MKRENDIVLYKNSKYKELKSYKKVKVNKIDSILLFMNSSLYGLSYATISPKTYNKLRHMSKIKFSYKFLDGELVDNDDYSEDDIWVKNVYYYNDPRELLGKLYEVYMTEICLNENFWVFDSFYSYLFKDFKISFIYKTKNNIKKYKFNDIVKFYKFLFGDGSIFTFDRYKKSLLSFTKKRYNITSIKKFTNKKLKNLISNDKNINYLISLNDSQLVNINPKFLTKYKSIEIESLLYITEIEGQDSSSILDSYIQNNIRYKYENYNIEYIYMIGCSPTIVRNLESSNTSFISYHTKNKIRKINGSKPKNNKLKKFNYIFKKYFSGVKYGSI